MVCHGAARNPHEHTIPHRSGHNKDKFPSTRINKPDFCLTVQQCYEFTVTDDEQVFYLTSF